MVYKLLLNFLFKKRIVKISVLKKKKSVYMSRCYSRDLRHMACQGLVVSFSMGEPTVFKKLLGTLLPAFSMASSPYIHSRRMPPCCKSMEILLRSEYSASLGFWLLVIVL